jgi:hypothetical protein
MIPSAAQQVNPFVVSEQLQVIETLAEHLPVERFAASGLSFQAHSLAKVSPLDRAQKANERCQLPLGDLEGRHAARGQTPADQRGQLRVVAREEQARDSWT